MRPRVLLADDHTLVLEAFTELLSEQCDIVGAVARTVRALIESAKTLKPDVVIADIGMPILNGIDAARQLQQLLPATKVIMLTMNEDPDLAVEAFPPGRRGICSNVRPPPSSYRHPGSDQQPFVGDAARDGGLHRFDPPGSSEGTRAETLTSRQREVLRLIAKGGR